jgi:hypothetical protein
LRPGVERIGANPISVLVLIAFWLVAARFASLVLETPKPEVKRRSDRKEVRMNGKLVAGSLLETAWAISVSVLASRLLPSP